MLTYTICLFSRTRSIVGFDYMAGNYSNGDTFYTFSVGIAICTFSLEWRTIRKGTD